MIVLGALLLLTWNVEQLLARWTSAAEFSVYLRDDATSEQRGAIEALIDQSGVAAGREYVSKAEALARFRREFAELGVADRAASTTIRFPRRSKCACGPDAERDGRAEALVERLAALPGVADVRYDREWLARVGAGLGTIRAAGLALAVLMAWPPRSPWRPSSGSVCTRGATSSKSWSWSARRWPSSAVRSSPKGSSRAGSARCWRIACSVARVPGGHGLVGDRISQRCSTAGPSSSCRSACACPGPGRDGGRERGGLVAARGTPAEAALTGR